MKQSDPQRAFFSSDGDARRIFQGNFDHKPFLFSHSLNLHPLLEFPALKKLAEKLASDKKPRGFFKLSGDSRESRWGSEKFQFELNKAFADIEASKMRMKLSSIHLEPGYGELLAQCTRELTALTSVNLGKEYRDPLATLFITSPNEITPFHIDSEANFLLQIYGTKTVHIYDGNDREVLEWRDIEEHWHGGQHVRLREGLESHASHFELNPGLGVHNPVHFPHWVQNGPSPSVSLSVAYTCATSPADVLHVNRYLRKMGLKPTPPGKSRPLDGAKSKIVSAARTVKKKIKGS